MTRGVWFTGRHRGRRAASTATVSVHVRQLAQLFNSLDPAPFWDRDLDRAAAEFIEDEFRDKQSADVWHLHVIVHEGDTSTSDLQTAIESYYGRLANSARLALHEHLRMGELGLLGGGAIFLLSMGIRGVLGGILGPLPPMLNEGLIILAWLALWRPAEALIYGWVPFFRNRRLFERLAGMRVSVRLSPPAPEGPHRLAEQLHNEPHTR
ncbi:MAG TPA: hypothetical protein VI653_22315 [Steroidobacteraceae bacterium]